MCTATSATQDGFELRQLQRLQPLVRTSLFIGATLFLTFAAWDALFGDAGLMTRLLPLRAGFAAALAALAFLSRPGSAPQRTVGILHTAVFVSATGITVLVPTLPDSPAFAVGSLGLMAIVLGATTSMTRQVLISSAILVATANAGLALNGYTLRSVGVVDVFLVPFVLVGCVLACMRGRLEREAWHLEQALLLERETLKHLASTDALTGAANRRMFLETARKLLAGAQRQGTPMSLLLLDVDHFKRINDTLGHAVGDATLRGLSATCLGTLRDGDLFGRLGGEEFAILLPATEANGAAILAERLRRLLAETEVVANGTSVRFTTSIGVATVGPGNSVEDVLARADSALYAAKRSGRNRVHAA